MIIAERTLFVSENGKQIELPIRLEAPQKSADGETWTCCFSIGLPDRIVRNCMVGTDAFSALDLAMRTIGSYLYSTTYHDEGRLSWLAPGAGYGFPIANSLRDLLIGDDAKYR